jgi:hypothetical protein
MVIMGLLNRPVETRFSIGTFERNILDRLESLVRTLPAGAARLEIGSHPTDPTCPYPFFLIEPTNEHSARIRGLIGGEEHKDGGISITIGQASYRELWINARHPERAVTRVDEFLQICAAVFTTYFSEDVTYDLQGKTVKSRLRLHVKGKIIVFSSGVLLQNPFKKTIFRRLQYQPYVNVSETNETSKAEV